MCKPRVCWSSRVVFTSPILWFSPSLDSSWCISSNPCEKFQNIVSPISLLWGDISSDRQTNCLLHTILKQKFIWVSRKFIMLYAYLQTQLDQKDSNYKFKECIKQNGTESVQKNSSSKTYLITLLRHVLESRKTSSIQRMKSCNYS